MAGRLNTLWLLALHAAVTGWYGTTVALHVDNTGTLPGGSLSYGGQWKYLTFIDLILQLVYFGLCVLVDILALTQGKGKEMKVLQTLTQLRDTIFATLAFPLAVFVMTSIWTIYGNEHKLVYPKKLNVVVQQWHDHAMHTTIVPIVLVEMYVTRHVYPSKKAGIATLAAFFITYVSWIIWVKHYSNIWAYPFLNEMSFESRVMFFSSSFMLVIGFYIVGEKLNNVFWVVEKISKEDEYKG
ncbi:androgen-induced gene 1 protein-like [Lethenteron reissneri]|uniref:androgen-induced gene 1 protein-like n=1 Tax=Lethenteron reissneri TaxID=7753 RepID=UPI002AB5EBB2|nr:androgen-induced gene 1 protein-like [Lethenteron reissneri]